MRKSFDGLCGVIQSQIKLSATSGEVFIFINKRRNQIKLLHWEQGGFILYYKRLEQGTFEIPKINYDTESCYLEWAQLVMMVEGISLKNIRRRKRFKLKKE